MYSDHPAVLVALFEMVPCTVCFITLWADIIVAFGGEQYNKEIKLIVHKSVLNSGNQLRRYPV